MRAGVKSNPMRPRWSPKQLVRSSLLAVAGVRDRVRAEQGVLLTFDDGPHPDVTPAVLDLLSEYRSKAVFFVVGNRIPLAPALLPRIVAEGHTIGNHTFRHPLNGVPGFVDYYRDVKECQAAIKEQIGVEPTLFRPPLGALTIGSLVAPMLMGLTTLMWSVDVADWKLRNADAATETGTKLGSECVPGDVVLLHDDNPCVVSLLNSMLPRIASRGVGLSNKADLVGA